MDSPRLNSVSNRFTDELAANTFVEKKQNRVEVSPIQETIDAQARKVFGKLQITEWYLPTKSEGVSIGKFSERQPRPVFDKETDVEIAKIEKMIKNSAENPEIPLPNLIIKGNPGVGKTMLLEDLCRKSNIGFIRLPSGAMENHLRCGTHIIALHDVLRIAALASTQVYIIMDDGEELVAKRSFEQKKATNLTDVAPWLKSQEEIGETIAQRRNAMVNSILEASGNAFRRASFATTTNRNKVIDAAFRTRSHTLKIMAPKVQERVRIIATHLRQIFKNDVFYLGFFNQGRLEDMALKTEGFTGRSIVNMLKDLEACVQLEEKKDEGEDKLKTGLTQELVNASIFAMQRSLAKDNELQLNSKTIFGIKKSAFRPHKIRNWVQTNIVSRFPVRR